MNKFRISSAVAGGVVCVFVGMASFIFGQTPTSSKTDPPGTDAYATLRIYDGRWSVRLDKADKADALENACTKTGKFYVCEQTVNGKFSGMVTFLPAKIPGHYYTQPLTADAHAAGRGDLTIEGNHWEYSSKDTEGEETTWYRTLNEVSEGGRRIRFTVQKSSDGKKWETTVSGVETKQP